MKQAIMIGAGNIGRGFIGAILEKSGWHVTFADVNMAVIDEINRQGRYTVYVQDVECQELVIEHVSGISSATADLEEAIASCDLITTAVGLNILPIIAGSVAKGIRARLHAGNHSPLNIIACENAIRATSRLKAAVYEKLNEEEAAFADSFIGFPDCAVDRIVPKSTLPNPIDVAVERFSEWDIEAAGWKGELPEIDGASFVENLDAYNQRKLFTLNGGHAICAYLGCLKGYRTIQESVGDPAIAEIVRGAMKQSGESLIRRFGFDPQVHAAYIERIFTRFLNPYLQDEVSRVGREPIRKLSPSDRLVRPLLAAYEDGLPLDFLAFGPAAALRYDNAGDSQSVELMQCIAVEGVEKALEKYTGLKPDSELATRILSIYRALGI